MPNIQQKTLNSHVILFDAEFFPQPSPSIFSSEYWQTQKAVTGQAKGRGTTYFFQQNNNHFVLRHYQRGGMIGKLLNDSYLFTGLKRSRAWQEFRLLQHMQTKNLASPTPVAAMLTKTGLRYQADLISVKIPNAKDLFQLLIKRRLDKTIWQNVGKTIAQFHHQQIYHHDLNIHNVMLDTSNKVWLIDFDKCCVKQGSNWKKANLARLKRSLEKEKRLNNIDWQEADWQILLNAYFTKING